MIAPRRRKRNESGRRQKARRKMLEQGPQSDLCFWCDKVMVVYPPNTNPQPPDCRTVEHILPLSLGGTNERENLVWACAECNVKRSAMTVDEIIRMNEAKIHGK